MTRIMPTRSAAHSPNRQRMLHRHRLMVYGEESHAAERIRHDLRKRSASAGASGECRGLSGNSPPDAL
jgi:hypothetical protein